MPLSNTPAFKPAVPPIPLGVAGTVLTSNGTSALTPPTFQPAATPPTLIQSAYTRTIGDPTGTVTLSASPTPGSTLLAIATGFDNQGGPGSEVSLPSGFGILQGQRYLANNQGIAAGIRITQTGDGVDWIFGGGNGGDTFGILEFASIQNVTNINSVPLTNDVNMLFGAGGVTTNSFCIGVVESDATNALVSVTGATLLFDGTSTDANHPGVIFQVTALANISLTYDTNAFGATIGMLITLT